MTTLVRRYAATFGDALITETATTGSVFGAKLAIVEALALTIIFLLFLVMVMSIIVVVLFLLLFPVAITFVGAALFVLAAPFTGEPASLDELVVFGREAEISPRQRHQCCSRARHLSQCRAAVLQTSQQTRPVVKPAFVHALPLPSSLLNEEPALSNALQSVFSSESPTARAAASRMEYGT